MSCQENIKCLDPCEPITFEIIINNPYYMMLVVFTILIWEIFFVSYLVGIYSEWYATLVQTGSTSWIIRGAWVLTTLLAYIGLYILWDESKVIDLSRNLLISALYLIASIITVAWTISLFQLQDLQLAFLAAIFLFLFQLAVLIYLFYLNPLVGILTVPFNFLFLKTDYKFQL